MSLSLFVRPHRKWASVREIIINRPEKRNALTLSMWAHLRELIQACNEDASVRVLILRGANSSAFAAGADISEFPETRSNLEQARSHKAITDAATKCLADARPITVSAISGYCFGGGMQIASACDMRLADESAVFAITPIKLGFVYGLYETELLVRLIGSARAKELLYTAKQIDAAQALSYGFLNDVFYAKPGSTESFSFDDFVDDHIAHLLRVAPKAQQAMKVMFSLLEKNDKLAEEAHRAAVSIEDAAFTSTEYREGINAFLLKRKPSYWQD